MLRLLQVRNAAVGALDAWVAAVPPEKVLPAVVDFLPNPKASNEGKVRFRLQEFSYSFVLEQSRGCGVANLKSMQR